MNVKDKVAFITGGASGIGLGIAKVLAGAGAKIVIGDLRADHCETAMQWFNDNGFSGQVVATEVDVSSPESLTAAADFTEASFGKVHILINNAGVDCSGPFKDATIADWDFATGVNFLGVAYGVQIFLPRLLSHGEGGHIVNTASLAGLTPMPADFVMYAGIKAAVVSMSEAWRMGLAEDNIGVSVLCPGPIKSNIHQSKLNRPERYKTSESFNKAADNLAKREVSDLWMEATDVGEMILDAIENNKLYVITHGEWRVPIQARFDAIMETMPKTMNMELLASLMPPKEED